jgi:peptidoglycan/xylan/chitin deacetylase (PgdA/CDA1 family)
MPLPLPQSSWARARRYYQRNVSRLLFRRRLSIRSARPLVSFTFDDFPRSALLAGGSILARYGMAGTYYTALGLLGTEGPSGLLFVLEDLKALLGQGHELGCHTFSHCDSWDTDSVTFEDAIIQNRNALGQMIPGAKFASFSYPISEPTPLNKRKAGKHFLCCRGGGQTFNVGTVDVNQLWSYFLEKTRDQIQPVVDLIEANREARGWLIFSTHDICASPSPYGCTEQYFEKVVQLAVASGARILPVCSALEAIRRNASLA